MQTKTQSLVESVINTGSGFIVGYAAGFVVFPMFGHTFTPAEIGGITLVFTGISIARNFAIRRLFNRKVIQ
jgi:multidrug transporter EmrE-like cation transporter